MITRRCPGCDADIAATATACDHCRTTVKPLSPAKIAEMERAAATADRQRAAATSPLLRWVAAAQATTQATTQATANLQPPTRHEIRELVEFNSAAYRRIADAGGNVHQASLDSQDALRRFADLLGPEQGTAFLTVYAQEADAMAAHVIDRTKTAEATMRRESAAGRVIGIWLVIAFVGYLLATFVW